MADVAAVVVTYNAMPWLERCLESLAGVECVVVDHGSSDGSVEAARTAGATRVEQGNLGLAAGWNRGLRETESRYVLILNADAWLVGRRTRAARRVRGRAPARGGRRAAAPEPRRDAPAVGARLPDALAARDRVPLPAEARAALAGAERVLCGRLRPRERDRGGVRDGRRDARPPRGDRGGRPARRVVLPLQRGGRLVLPLPAGGLAGVLHTRGGSRPRRRRLARRAPVRPAGARPSPLPRQAPRPRLRRARPDAARRLAAPARAARSAASAGRCTARARASSPPAVPRRSSR